MITIKVWSDFACPFCFIGRRKLQSAIDGLDIAGNVEIEYKCFQLDTGAQRVENREYAQLIAKKYGIPVSMARKNVDSLIAAANEAGIAMDLDNAVHNNTQDAHRLAKYAASLGRESEIIEALFSAYFEKNLDIGSPSVLSSLAEELGLDRDGVGEMLKSGRYTAEVLADQKEAVSSGISSVPFYVLNDTQAISGAQPVSEFTRVLSMLSCS